MFKSLKQYYSYVFEINEENLGPHTIKGYQGRFWTSEFHYQPYRYAMTRKAREGAIRNLKSQKKVQKALVNWYLSHKESLLIP
mgnify:CR=1 FL=1